MQSIATRLLFCCLLSFVVFAQHTHSLQAETVNVADHGIVPGKDVTLAVKQLLHLLQDREDVTLVFPKGQYDFHPDNAVETYRGVANHDNGLKRFGVPLFNRNRITIDGDGSLFLFHGRMVPITVDNSEHITIRNLTIDWTQPFHAEMRVVECNESNASFVVQTDPSLHPYTISDGQIRFHRYGQDDPIGSNILLDPKTRAPIHRTGNYKVNGKRAKITEIGPGKFRVENGAKKAPPVGSVWVAYGVHPTSRLCPAIHVTDSTDVKIENVTVHAAGGMALIVERTEDISLDEMKVSSNSGRLAATRADATHFIGCKGTVKIENCLFEHMLDDGVNVHGVYVKVVEPLNKRRLLCEISHFQQWGLTFSAAGDRVALISRETLLPVFETTVESVQPLNEHRFVMTLADYPAELPDGPMSVENLTWHPDLVIRNCIIRENRARSVLVTTKGNVLIEGNTFASQMHGILIEGDNNKWYESGAVQDVTIRNNVFDNVGFAVDKRYPLLTSPLLTDKQRTTPQRYHSNIRFVDNKIASFNGLLVKARSVRGLVIQRNKIELSKNYPITDEGPAVVIESCDDVSIDDNEFIGFDHAMTVECSASNRVHTSGNFGLAVTETIAGKASFAESEQSEKPNIVLLFVDDLGWNDVGYRNAKFETPNIDRLASEGVEFQRAYVASPTCSPSRATLLTGKHPVRLQMVRHIPTDPKHGFDKFGRTDQEFNQWESDPAEFPSRNWLSLEHTSYAEALGQLGYFNQFFGKWHLGHEPYHPIEQGFHVQVGTANAGHPKSYRAPFFKNSDVLTDVKQGYLTDVLTDRCVETIKNYDRDQPFMLSMWYYNVHRPPMPREDLLAHFKARGYDDTDAIYASQVKAVDESVGRIRDALNQRGIADNSVVVFLSDQGSWHQNLPLRGSKRTDTLCEGGARVPMIVHWPGVTKPGTKENSLVQSTDLFPTFVEIAGGDVSDHTDLDGISLLPALRGETLPDRGEPLFGYRAYEDLYASVREGNWKLLAHRSGKVNLYNIATDESEQRDVAHAHPSIVDRLSRDLIDWETKMNIQQYSGVQ